MNSIASINTKHWTLCNRCWTRRPRAQFTGEATCLFCDPDFKERFGNHPKAEQSSTVRQKPGPKPREIYNPFQGGYRTSVPSGRDSYLINRSLWHQEKTEE